MKFYQKNKINKSLAFAILLLAFTACKTSGIEKRTANTAVPESFVTSTDTTNIAKINWRQYFTDPFLIALIDTGLNNNQELNIMVREIQIARNEVRGLKGEYLPFVGLGAGGGADKVSRYTSQGGSDEITEIAPGTPTPKVIPDYEFGAYATWEIDIWKKLRNAKKASVSRYLASIDGKNFMVTNLIAEISNTYYELMALDNQLEIVKLNIEIQTNALKIVKMQKEAAQVTELAVRRFEALVYHTRALEFDILQQIVEAENHINFLVGRFPQPVQRNAVGFIMHAPPTVLTGIPAQLLANRPDVHAAEMALEAAKLDVKVARARFYPSLNIRAGVGFQAFNPQYLIQSPQALLFNMAGDLATPLINRNAIKAAYKSANTKQIQAVYDYEKTILSAYIEVANQLANISNLERRYDLKSKEVLALNQSTEIANNLFRSARANYMEVLLTQRDALESKFDLIETKKQQMNAVVNIYKSLGGGWQ